MLTHRNLVANVLQMQAMRTRASASDDAIIGVLPFFHIYGMRRDHEPRPRATARRSSPCRASTSSSSCAHQTQHRASDRSPTSCRRSCSRSPSTRSSTAVDLSELRLIVLGRGAARRGAGARALAARLGCRVMQGYGMTETSPVTHADAPRRPRPIKPGSVGSPRARTPSARSSTRHRRGRGAGAGRRALGPRAAGDEGLPQPARGDRARRSTPTAGCTPATSAYVDEDGYFFDRRPAQGADQVQGLPGRPGRARGAAAHPPGGRRRRRDPEPRRGGRRGAEGVRRAAGRGRRPRSSWPSSPARVAPYKKIRRLEFIDQIPKSPSGKILRRVLVEQQRTSVAEARPN